MKFLVGDDTSAVQSPCTGDVSRLRTLERKDREEKTDALTKQCGRSDDVGEHEERMGLNINPMCGMCSIRRRHHTHSAYSLYDVCKPTMNQQNFFIPESQP